MSMSEDSELREALRAELRKLRELELAAIKQEIAPLEESIGKQQKKLEKLQQRLSELQVNDEDWLARQLTELAEKPAKAVKAKSKPKSKPVRPELDEPAPTDAVKTEASSP